MARPMNPRKRPAPGTSPPMQESSLSQPPAFRYPPTSLPVTEEQLYGRTTFPMTTTAPGLTDPSLELDPNAYALQPVDAFNQSQQLGLSPLVNSPNNQQLVTRQRPFVDADQGWGEQDAAQLESPAENSYGNEEHDIEALERRAQLAKRDAQAKRKQIPPFVQKLSSFLDESRNTELIRWSDDGRSFVVLDEDEFAKRLIPELFKHSNYASFVRQLNMYGFHKKVGLSDNSMRASERRNKSPSEYANRYFIRGHPNLLWLINKPKNPHAPARGGKDRQEVGTPTPLNHLADRDGSAAPHDGVAGGGQADEYLDGSGHMIASGQDLAEVRRQLKAITEQQRLISGAINRLRREHSQIYEQAGAFRALHERHENSINAILTFLATVYNRSLEGHGGQNFANVLAGTMSADAPTPRTHDPTNPQQTATWRKQRLLLAPPPADSGLQTDRATTVSPSASATTPGPPQATSQAASSPGIEAGGATSPAGTDIMSMINMASGGDAGNNSNTNDPTGQGQPRVDFSTALTQFHQANGHSPLMAGQRTEMLQQMIAQNSNGKGNNSSNSRNALVAAGPTPPIPRMPDLIRLQDENDELDRLQRMQAEQDYKVQELTNMVQPLSPNGSIPGMPDAPSPYLNGGLSGGGGGGGPNAAGLNGNGASSALDFDQIFSNDDYFTAQGGNGGGGGGGGTSLVDFAASGAGEGEGAFDLEAFVSGEGIVFGDSPMTTASNTINNNNTNATTTTTTGLVLGSEVASPATTATTTIVPGNLSGGAGGVDGVDGVDGGALDDHSDLFGDDDDNDNDDYDDGDDALGGGIDGEYGGGGGGVPGDFGRADVASRDGPEQEQQRAQKRQRRS